MAKRLQHFGAAAESVQSTRRQFPIGAEVQPQGVHFRVWAPRRHTVSVVIEDSIPGSDGKKPVGWHAGELDRDDDGCFSGLIDAARPGTRYRFVLDDDPAPYPDPASRFQPEGPFGPSQVIDPASYPWRDENWRGIQVPGQVLYEMHVGTFTQEGTWQAAMEQLPELATTGITLLELMPVADFAGKFGWGYDGVNIFAPTRLYGSPDDFRAFVDRAHEIGLGVILDVVYNHFGVTGNFISQFSPYYFTDRYENEWGEAVNFDGEHAEQVRSFFVTNVRYWIREFHVDGFRFDATQQFFDSSSRHILSELSEAARQEAGTRCVVLVAENEPQDVRLVRPLDQGGFGMDALWNDDFHRSATVALTNKNDGYYSDYRGEGREFIAALKWGYLFQGQRFHWQDTRRGTPTFGLPAATFVNYLQNHDQVANSATGRRLQQSVSPAKYRVVTALLLLGPGTPMLFQGQEYSATTPFLYFNDAPADLASAISSGRAKFLSQFRTLATPEIQDRLPDPIDPLTFMGSKLDRCERNRNSRQHALHKDLLRLRREDPVFRQQNAERLHGVVLTPSAFVIRFFGDEGDDRLIIANLGLDTAFHSVAEPLMAPPAGSGWELLWSSEDPKYGGQGTPPVETEKYWWLLGDALVVLKAVPITEAARDAAKQSSAELSAALESPQLKPAR